ncbi:MAG: leucyl aminopeptidase [Gammaproteobacteria bacterium]|nr:leucyl aminopeptidase [Gammaproteobacteria bacterium]
MEISVTTRRADAIKSGCVVAAIFEKGKLSTSAKRLDKATSGRLSELVKESSLQGKAGQQLLLHDLDGIDSDRVLLVGAGKSGKLDPPRFQKVAGTAVSGLRQSGAADAAVYLDELDVADRDGAWKVRVLVEGLQNAVYRFDQLKSDKSSDTPERLSKLSYALKSKSAQAAARRAIRQANAISAGTELARTLGDLPGNICTPSYLADEARRLGKTYKSITVRALGEAEMKRMGMGTLLSVARGSEEAAKLIIIEYRGGRKNDNPVALVGKGVTFDSGGISIKPAAAMDEMKYDMCGAASVFGAVKAVAELKLKLNVVAVIPATENLPGGNASKPGDIYTSMSGQTVEILNTDAEGRLILCDALTYASRYEPQVVIDVATLTGACVIALGSHASGLFTNDERLAKELLKAGEYSGDRAWRLPLWEEYSKQLESNFADMANVGGRDAGAITAASFLSKFTKDFRWAHLDIAGTAWRTGKEKGATGRPVPLLTQFLINRAGRAG